MGVNVDRHAQIFHQCPHQFTGDVRGQQAGHVLDGNTVTAHVLHALARGDELFDGVDRAGGITNRTLGVLAGLLDGLDGDLQIAHVI